MPTSIKDRCTEAHEHILFFTKEPTYYFDMDSIRERSKTIERPSRAINENKDATVVIIDKDGNRKQRLRKSTKPNVTHHLGRHKRDVWEVNTVSSTSSFKDLKDCCGDDDVHPAAYSEELILPCILAGCPEGGIVLDPFIGAGTTAIVALKNKRNYSGIELNPEFAAFAEKRIATIDMDKINGNNTLKEMLIGY
jgi:DNA modification methylase